MTERMAGERVDDRLEAAMYWWGAKAIRKTQPKMVEATVQLSDITKESEEMQIEVERGL